MTVSQWDSTIIAKSNSAIAYFIICTCAVSSNIGKSHTFLILYSDGASFWSNILLILSLLFEALSVSDKPSSGSVGSSAGAVWTFWLRENLITDWLWAKKIWLMSRRDNGVILTHTKCIRVRTDNVPAVPTRALILLSWKSRSPHPTRWPERAGTCKEQRNHRWLKVHVHLSGSVQICVSESMRTRIKWPLK